MAKLSTRLSTRGPRAAIGASTLLIGFGVIASWILADSPTSRVGPMTAINSTDGGAVIITGELPSAQARDALFEVLAEAGDITVIVSEVRIMPEVEPPVSIAQLADSLLADLARVGETGD